MTFRNKLSVAITITGALLALILVAVPSGPVEACLPCTCQHTLSLNCSGPYMAFAEGGPGQCEITVQKIEPGYPTVMDLTPAELAALPANPTENILVESFFEFNLYKLTSGEFQLNVGPDAESKVHVLNFRACPATDVRESTFIVQPQ